MFSQDQISFPFSIYKVFTGSNQSPFFDLQCCCRVKSVSLFRFTVLFHGQIGLCFRFTRFLQSQTSLPFSIYKVLTASNESPFFDLQCYYRVKLVTLFDLQGFYRVKSVSRFIRLLQGKISLPFSIFSVFTG